MGTKDTGLEPVMTAKELGEYLRLDPNTIYRRFRKGEIPGVRIGKAIRFKKEVIDAWLRRMSWACSPERRDSLRRWAEEFVRERAIREEDVNAAIARRRAG